VAAVPFTVSGVDDGEFVELDEPPPPPPHATSEKAARTIAKVFIWRPIFGEDALGNAK